MIARVAALVVLAVASLPACAPADTCAADDECADDARCVDGRCRLVVLVGDDGGAASDDDDAGDASDVDDGGALVDTDAGADADGGVAPDDDDAGPIVSSPDGGASPGLCPVVDDDQLTAAELPTALGVQVRFIEVTSDAGVPVDLAGDVVDDTTTWRFDQEIPGDERITVEAESIDDLWFAADFPDATYVAKLDSAGTNYGVFKRDDDGIVLLGAASAVEGDTLLHYDPAVVVLSFPLYAGKTWTTTTDDTGTFEGNAFYSSTDTYTTTVDAVGQVITTAGAFDVMRLRVVQDVEVPIAFYPWILSYHWVRYSFVTACWGEIAHVDSAEGEEDDVFTTAARVRRIGIGP